MARWVRGDVAHWSHVKTLARAGGYGMLRQRRRIWDGKSSVSQRTRIIARRFHAPCVGIGATLDISPQPTKSFSAILPIALDQCSFNKSTWASYCAL